MFCLSFDDILGTSLKVVNFLLVEIFLLDTLLLFSFSLLTACFGSESMWVFCSLGLLLFY